MDERTRRIKSPNVCPKTRMCSDKVRQAKRREEEAEPQGWTVWMAWGFGKLVTNGWIELMKQDSLPGIRARKSSITSAIATP
jgi:hypothetical protein